MTPRFYGQTSLSGLVFFVGKSPVGIIRDQGALEKNFNFHLEVMVEFSSDIERGLFCQA